MSEYRRGSHGGPDSADDSAADPGRSNRNSSEFQASVARLERAVDELVGTARSRFADRATSFIDEATARLEGDPGRRQERGRSRESSRDDLDPLPRRLYRDPRRGRIVGVCAGIARYYGAEPWVVRCIAITGLIFFPTLVFPAYWIAYVVMDRAPGLDDDAAPRRRRRRRSRRDEGRDRDSSPTPELGPRLSPRGSLRNVKADLTEVELRLRRMETHVTSGRYELQRELTRIESRT